MSPEPAPIPASACSNQERIKELEKRKAKISDEMDRIVRDFGLDDVKSRAVGCLRLEETYCTKNGKRYGPYGPYYYLYFHRTEKLEKRYVGKEAGGFRARRDIVAELKRLEAEYKGILKLERQLARDRSEHKHPLPPNNNVT